MKKYNEKDFQQALFNLYGETVRLVGNYTSLYKSVTLEDKYGIMKVTKAILALRYRPGIKAAIDKTSYFMNQLKESHPSIYKELCPITEYKAMKVKMTFLTKYGAVAVTPDALIHGHIPNVRSAVNKKEYMRNQLLDLYNGKYDFIIDSTDRHVGRIRLICPIHGEVSVDSCHIFSACGCPKCNNTQRKSNCLYVIRLSNQHETFLKLGITYYKSGQLRRMSDYCKLGYSVEVLVVAEYSSYEECFAHELKLKELIKKNLVTPQVWPNKSSEECFEETILDLVISNI